MEEKLKGTIYEHAVMCKLLSAVFCQAFLKMSRKSSNISTGFPVLFYASR